jgi:hypothetical protein
MSLQYIAGFFDGEGTIRISAKGGLQISIAQKGERGRQVLNAIRSDLTLLGVTARMFGVTKQAMYPMGVTGQENVLKLCRLLLPYLHVKRTEVADHLRFYTLFPRMQPGSVAARLRHWEGMTIRRQRSGF